MTTSVAIIGTRAAGLIGKNAVHTVEVCRVDREPDWMASQSRTTYYWCCEADGACGTHKLSPEAALDEAVAHIKQAHQEDLHGREEAADGRADHRAPAPTA